MKIGEEVNRVKKNVKVVIASIIVLAICYIAFVAVDCVRLSVCLDPTRSDLTYKKPFITVSREQTDSAIKYHGLGYSLEYYINENNESLDDEDMIKKHGYGAMIYLLDRFILWGWVT